MRLTPTERDRLLLFGAAELARARRARGLRLNVPEATALIADTVCEAARDGRRLAEAIEAARGVLGPDDVLPGVADVVTEVHVEAVFDDGSRLAVVSDPIGGAEPLGDDAPGRACCPAPRARRARARTSRLTRAQHRDRAGQRHLALPLLRGQPAARLRPGRGLRDAAVRPRRLVGPLRPGRRGRGRPAADRRRPDRDRLRRPGRRPAGRAGREGGGPAPGRGLRLSRSRQPGAEPHEQADAAQRPLRAGQPARSIRTSTPPSTARAPATGSASATPG